MKKVKLEINDTGLKLANTVLLMQELIEYARKQAGLNPVGIARLVSLFEKESKSESEK